MTRTVALQEIKEGFDSFEEANAFWGIQMESIRGYKVRSAYLSYEDNYDTKLGKWRVYIRWYEIPADTPIVMQSFTEMVNNGT